MVKTRAFTAVDLGSIPGQGTKIPQAVRCSQRRKKKTKKGADHKVYSISLSFYEIITEIISKAEP